MRIFLSLTMMLLLVSEAHSQASTNWRGERMVIEHELGDELESIAQWCRENGIEDQVDLTLGIFQNRDLGRQYIFLPSEKSMSKGTDDILGQWLVKVNAAKVAHAERVFELAKKASQQDAGAIAFQLLYEVIHYNRDHATVREILGHVKTEDGWKVASDSVRVKPGTRRHDVLTWPAKSYIRVLTPHFEIESNVSEERTIFLAEQLERTQLVWRQVFFEYWSKSEAVKRWIDGNGKLNMPRQRFRVVFFKDKASYVQDLQPIVRGIEASTGYYSSDQEISFFYDGDARVQDTWRHELTHQLFRETGRANKQAFEEQFIWLDEGIATYFESIVDFDSYVTLGGFESHRMQYARVRRLLENYHLPIAELSAIGRTTLQQHDDMRRIYSEASGLTDMLMNDESGKFEKPLTEFLRLIFKGRVKDDAFEKIIGESFAQLDERYENYLKVDSGLVESHLSKPETRTELSLPGADLKSAAFDEIAKCVNLNWLDLSKNQINSADFAKLGSCTQINQLILTGCRFERESLRALELFPLLDDVDLSGSQVQDNHLSNFGQLKNLRSLRLTATDITDQGLARLYNVSNLKSLDVTRTRVTNQGIANLKAYLPNLVVTKSN